MPIKPTYEEKTRVPDRMLENRIRFEKLIADISATFVNIPGHEVDEKIEAAFQRIGEILGIDQIEFIQHIEETGQFAVTHSWRAEPNERTLHIDSYEQLPWIAGKICCKETVTFSSLDDLPKEAATDREKFEKYNIRSAAIIPCVTEPSVLHTIVFESYTPAHDWPEEMIEQLRIIGQVFSRAIRCKQGVMELQSKHEQRMYFEELLTELSATFVKMPSDELDEIVESVLRRIGKILGIDRTDFVRIEEEMGQVSLTHSWTGEGIKHLPLMKGKDFPWIAEELRSGKELNWSSPDDLPEEASRDKKSLKKLGVHSGLVIPYTKEGPFMCAIAFGSHSDSKLLQSEVNIQRIRLLGEVIYNALRRQEADQELSNAFSEIKALKDQLQKENIFLREEIKLVHKHEEIIGNSDGIRRVLGDIEQVAETNSTVLIHGETGTGKELVARAIHNLSSRKDMALVTVNCAALPGSLVEAELFGREKGAYTGAISRQVGRFEIADGATIFLDEIGELPMELQVKLLRVLQSGQFERLGSSKTMRVDVRVIAASNRDLEKAIRDGRFREDLFYRLNVFPIQVPPLRERREDIVALTWAFVKEFSENMGKLIRSISRNSLEAMQRYQWPGNIRELRNVIERAMIVSKEGTLIIDVPSISQLSAPHDLPMEEYERRYILKILEQTGWQIRGKRGAAEILGLKPTTLHSRMKKHGIQRPRR